MQAAQPAGLPKDVPSRARHVAVDIRSAHTSNNRQPPKVFSSAWHPGQRGLPTVACHAGVHLDGTDLQPVAAHHPVNEQQQGMPMSDGNLVLDSLPPEDIISLLLTTAAKHQLDASIQLGGNVAARKHTGVSPVPQSAPSNHARVATERVPAQPSSTMPASSFMSHLLMPLAQCARDCRASTAQASSPPGSTPSISALLRICTGLLHDLQAQQLQHAHPAQLATGLWAVGALHASLLPQARHLHMPASGRSGSDRGGRSGPAVLLRTCMRQLRHAGPRLAGELGVRGAAGMQQAGPVGLAGSLWALAKLEILPDEQWSADYRVASLALLCPQPQAVPLQHGSQDRHIVLAPSRNTAVRSTGNEPHVALPAGPGSMLTHTTQYTSQAEHSRNRHQHEHHAAQPCSANVYGPQELSMTLWALARLQAPAWQQKQRQYLQGHSPPGRGSQATQAQHVAALIAAAHAQVHLASQQAMANTLWALAKLQPGAPLDPAFLAAWYTRFLNTFVDPACCPGSSSPVEAKQQQHHLSQALWALARMRTPVDHVWLAALLAETLPSLHAASAQSLANSMWALGELKHTPAVPWLHSFLSAAQAQAHRLTLQGFCCLLGGLVHADCQVPRAWMTAVTQASASHVLTGSCSGLQLSALLWAVAGLGGGAHPRLVHAAMRVAPHHLEAGTQHLAACARRRRAAAQEAARTGSTSPPPAAAAVSVIAAAASSATATAVSVHSSTAWLQAIAVRPVARVARLAGAVVSRTRAPAWRRRMHFYLLHVQQPLPPARPQSQQDSLAGQSSADENLSYVPGHVSERASTPHRAIEQPQGQHRGAGGSGGTRQLGSLGLARLLHGLAHAFVHPGTQETNEGLGRGAWRGAPPWQLSNACVLALRASLPELDIRTLALALPAVLALGVRPPRPPMRRALRRVLLAARPHEAPCLATLLAALAPMGAAATAKWQAECMQRLQPWATQLTVGGVLQLARALPYLQAHSAHPSCAGAPARKHALAGLAGAVAARAASLLGSMVEADMCVLVAGVAGVSTEASFLEEHGTSPLQVLVRGVAARVPHLPLPTLVHCAAALAAHLPPATLPASPVLMHALEAATLPRLSTLCISGADRVGLLVSLRRLGHVPGPAWYSVWYATSLPHLARLGPTQLGSALKLCEEVTRERPLSAPPPAWVMAAWTGAAAAQAAATWALGKQLTAGPEALQLGAKGEGEQEGVRRSGMVSGVLVATLTRLLTLSMQTSQASPNTSTANVSQQQHLLGQAAGHIGLLTGAVQAGTLPPTAALFALHELRSLQPLHPVGIRAVQGAAQQLLQTVVSCTPTDVFAAIWEAAAATHSLGDSSGRVDALPWSSHATTLILTSGKGCRRTTAPLAATKMQNFPSGNVHAARLVAATAAAMVVELVAGSARWGCPGLRASWLMGAVRQCAARVACFTGPQAATLLKAVALVHSRGFAAPDQGGRAEPGGRNSSAGWEEAVLSLLDGALPALCAQAGHTQLAEVAWALSTLQVQPSTRWWSAYEAELGNRLPHLPPNDLAEVIWALGALRRRPSHAWMERYASVAATQMSRMGADQLARLVWALAAIEQAPTPALMDRYLAATGTLLAASNASLTSAGQAMPRAFSAGGLALMVGGLAALDVQPHPAWLARFTRVLTAALPECRGAQLAKAVCSLAQLGAEPEASLLSGAVAAAAARLAAADLDPGSANELRWAVARLDNSPDHEHLAALDAVFASAGRSHRDKLAGNKVASSKKQGAGNKPAGNKPGSSGLREGGRPQGVKDGVQAGVTDRAGKSHQRLTLHLRTRLNLSRRQSTIVVQRQRRTTSGVRWQAKKGH